MPRLDRGCRHVRDPCRVLAQDMGVDPEGDSRSACPRRSETTPRPESRPHPSTRRSQKPPQASIGNPRTRQGPSSRPPTAATTGPSQASSSAVRAPPKGEMAAAVDDGTSRRGTPWPVVTSASRLVVSVRGCLLESIRGRHYNDESGALPSRFIGQSLAGLDDGIGIDRLTFVTRGTIFRMFGKVQDLLTGDSSTDARRYRRRRMPSARRRASAPRRPVERALRGILTCCVKREFQGRTVGVSGVSVLAS